jgi:hypothetical protein
MGKTKIPDSQLVEKLRDKQYTSYYAVAKAVGLNCNTDFINRCHRLEELYGIPVRIPSRQGRPVKNTKPMTSRKLTDKPPLTLKEWEELNAKIMASDSPEPKIIGFPFGPGEQVYYEYRLCTVERVFKDKIILRRNSDLKLVTLTMEEYLKNPEILRRIDKKPPIKSIGEAITTKRDEGEPFDLEMDDTTESTKDFGPLFGEVDYIDDAWLKPTARKLSIKEKIKKCVAILFGEVEK